MTAINEKAMVGYLTNLNDLLKQQSSTRDKNSWLRSFLLLSSKILAEGTPQQSLQMPTDHVSKLLNEIEVPFCFELQAKQALKNLIDEKFLIGEVTEESRTEDRNLLRARGDSPQDIELVRNVFGYDVPEVATCSIELYETKKDLREILIAKELIMSGHFQDNWVEPHCNQSQLRSEEDFIKGQYLEKWKDVRVTKVVSSTSFWAVIGREDIGNLTIFSEIQDNYYSNTIHKDKDGNRLKAKPGLGEIVLYIDEEERLQRCKVVWVHASGLVDLWSMDEGSVSRNVPFDQLFDCTKLSFFPPTMAVRLCKVTGVSVKPAYQVVEKCLLILDLFAGKNSRVRDEILMEGFGFLSSATKTRDSNVRASAFKLINTVCVGIDSKKLPSVAKKFVLDLPVVFELIREDSIGAENSSELEIILGILCNFACSSNCLTSIFCTEFDVVAALQAINGQLVAGRSGAMIEMLIGYRQNMAREDLARTPIRPRQCISKVVEREQTMDEQHKRASKGGGKATAMYVQHSEPRTEVSLFDTPVREVQPEPELFEEPLFTHSIIDQIPAIKREARPYTEVTFNTYCHELRESMTCHIHKAKVVEDMNKGTMEVACAMLNSGKGGVIHYGYADGYVKGIKAFSTDEIRIVLDRRLGNQAKIKPSVLPTLYDVKFVNVMDVNERTGKKSAKEYTYIVELYIFGRNDTSTIFTFQKTQNKNDEDSGDKVFCVIRTPSGQQREMNSNEVAQMALFQVEKDIHDQQIHMEALIRQYMVLGKL